jgi:predicted metal-dependent hydrolase
MERSYPQPYVLFLTHFHGDRDYFECHELLEEYWKEHPESPYRTTWVGLIQAAVGMYHYRRGNKAGAIKSLTGALRRSDPHHLQALGIDAAAWLELLADTLDSLRSNKTVEYRDINIPITDQNLIHACLQLCKDMGCDWGAPSRMEVKELIHRHTLRDRTDVIEARQRSLERRRGGL